MKELDRDGRWAWLETDQAGRVIRTEGDFEGLLGRTPVLGSSLAEAFTSVLDVPSEGLQLPALSFVEGVSFDLMVCPSTYGQVAVAVERTEREALTQRLQQARLELELELESTKRQYELALAGADMTLFREEEPGLGFVWLGPEQTWVRQRFGDHLRVGERVELRAQSDFLATLLDEMEGNRDLQRLDPVPFHEGDGPLLQAKLLRGGKKSRMVVLVRHRDGQAPGLDFLQTGREIQSEKQIVLRALEERDVLVHCVVHDLASPLQAVTSALGLLQDATPEWGEKAELLQLAVQETHRQSRMIKEIEQIFDSEAEQPGEDSVDVARAAAAIIPVLRLSWPEVAFVVHGGEPPAVRGDVDRLLRVLQNLLDNAARHSPSEGEVHVRFARTDADALRVSVHDSGPGVSSDLDVFGRGTKGRRSGRWGLGLFYCKITIERWGGKIGHQASDLGGEEFWFELPLFAPADAD